MRRTPDYPRDTVDPVRYEVNWDKVLERVDEMRYERSLHHHEAITITAVEAQLGWTLGVLFNIIKRGSGSANSFVSLLMWCGETDIRPYIIDV